MEDTLIKSTSQEVGIKSLPSAVTIKPVKVTQDARRPILLVSDPRYTVVTAPKLEIVPTHSVMGAIFWLYFSTKSFKEVWIDTEIVWDVADRTPLPVTYRDGRFLCEFLQQWAPPVVPEVIRIITKNPVHLREARVCLEGKYNISYNILDNQGKPWASVCQRPNT